MDGSFLLGAFYESDSKPSDRCWIKNTPWLCTHTLNSRVNWSLACTAHSSNYRRSLSLFICNSTHCLPPLSCDLCSCRKLTFTEQTPNKRSRPPDDLQSNKCAVTERLLSFLLQRVEEDCASQVGPVHHCNVEVDHMLDPVMSCLLTLPEMEVVMCVGGR